MIDYSIKNIFKMLERHIEIIDEDTGDIYYSIEDRPIKETDFFLLKILEKYCD